MTKLKRVFAVAVLVALTSTLNGCCWGWPFCGGPGGPSGGPGGGPGGQGGPGSGGGPRGDVTVPHATRVA